MRGFPVTWPVRQAFVVAMAVEVGWLAALAWMAWRATG
jgi:hypothetical protein